MLVWQRKGESHARVYAFRGWGDATAVSEANRARLGRRRYRERFGIETSYRQKNQARGWTTSTNPEYRLLLEGVALLLRQVWVYLTLRIARARGLAPTAWVAQFRWPRCSTGSRNGSAHDTHAHDVLPCHTIHLQTLTKPWHEVCAIGV
ncbi:hypothetical protein J8F10_00545 [Gemmata sp. G18]|uniref:Transposase DDE domain-containing protein n=1 Tax=Gemmata palustris TaxID=2822762 RepID=A0ABS5BJC5_9BACT|nr:hypothetical protein [Gemmata palustris]MBP3953789.1 hypothetical protein [Gemmata palustris]